MSDLSLPVLDRNATARDALAQMKQRAISGIVARHEGRFLLYTAGQVVVALSENPDVTLAVLDPERELSPILPQNREATRSGYSIAVRHHADFGAKDKGKDELREATFSVEAGLLRLLQGGPEDCYCKVDGKPVADGKTGDDCPDGHRGSVRCV